MSYKEIQISQITALSKTLDLHQGLLTTIECQIKDLRRTPSFKKSQYLCNALTNFDKISHSDASRPSKPCQPIKFCEFENPRWRTAAILKNKMSISRQRTTQSRLQILTKLGTTMHLAPSLSHRTTTANNV